MTVVHLRALVGFCTRQTRCRSSFRGISLYSARSRRVRQFFVSAVAVISVDSFIRVEDARHELRIIHGEYIHETLPAHLER